MSRITPARTRSGDLALVGAAALGAATLAASLLFLVLVRAAITQEGYRTQDLRAALVEERARAADLRVERARLLRPARLAQLARAIDMDAPTPSQVLAPAVVRASTAPDQAEAP